MAYANLVKSAVVKAPVHSRRGLQERAFALAFSGLVYPQIWEDPEVDIVAMAPLSGMRVATIASGGCNILAYLTEDVAEVLAVDLNPAHVALNKLKLAAFKYLPSYEDLFRFFGEASHPGNADLYRQWLAPSLDAVTRDYWNHWTVRGRRISQFSRNFYRYGLLGRFIALVHVGARLHGVDPRRMMAARDMDEQGRLFDETLGPVFDSWIIRWVCRRPASLFGLGIPPAQFDDLKSASGGNMAQLLRARLRRLACDFPLADNYFAWQAFARHYDVKGRRGLPRYLQENRFDALRDRVDRVQIEQVSLTDRLRAEPANSLDRFVLLDAQDWMDDQQLSELWAEIYRTARPGARVIFRTAGEETILPGRLPPARLAQWRYEAAASRDGHRRDRSSIYGGFHLYTLKDA